MSDIYRIPVTTIDGAEQTLAPYRGKYLLIVNTASQCGYTPQYAGLEALHRTLGPKGVEVLGFPCNQFGGQEPGDANTIKEFCSLRYDVSFPMFAKIDVNGTNTHPLYELLKREKPGVLGIEAVKWNFTKFLVGPDGTVLKRYAPADAPETIQKDLERLLG